MRIAQTLGAIAIATSLATAVQAQSAGVLEDVATIIANSPVGSRPDSDATRICFRAVDHLLETEDTAGAARAAGFLQDFCHRGLSSELEREGLFSLLSEIGLEAPSSETDLASLAQAIAACWNIGSLSREAQGVSMTVEFDATHDGRVVFDSIALVDGSSGSAAAIQQAFESVRRAIVRCGVNRFPQIRTPGQYQVRF